MTTRIPTRANARRIKAAAKALAGYRKADQLDPGANVTDLLTDLRHWCDAEGLFWADLDRVAYQHYLGEIRKK